jgi:hypothetical protein
LPTPDIIYLPHGFSSFEFTGVGASFEDQRYWLCSQPLLIPARYRRSSATSMRVVQLETLTCASSGKKWTFLFQGALLGNVEDENVQVSISTETVTIHEKDSQQFIVFFFLHHRVEESKCENPHAPSSAGDSGESHFNFLVPQFVFLDFLGLTHRLLDGTGRISHESHPGISLRRISWQEC